MMFTARDVMTSDVIWITPQHSLQDAFMTMMQFNVSHLPVIAAQTVVGLISKKTLFSCAINNRQRGMTQVEHAMARKVFSCLPHDSLPAIVEMMTKDGINAVPVVSKNELIGIITATDILRHTLAAKIRIA